MNLWNYFCTCGKEDKVKEVTIIHIVGALSSFGITLKNHPLFEWCIKYSQEEGIHPIICCLDREVNRWCNKHGIDFLTPSLGVNPIDLIKQVTTFYPADIVYLLDPSHPILPRGLLRSMRAYLLSRDIASISAGGVSAYDVGTVLKSRQLSPFSSHVSLSLPKVCDFCTYSTLKRSEIEKACTHVFDPWYSPDSVSIAIENQDIDPEPLWQSDLRVKLDVPMLSHFPLGMNWDVIVSDKLPTPTSTYTLEDLGWSSDVYIWKRLSPMAQTILFFSTIYPKAKISWYGDITYNPSLETIRDAKSKEHVHVLGNNYIMEKTFWKQLNISVGKSDVGLAFPDPEKCDKLTIVTSNWSDTVIIDTKSERGGRLANRDSFTVLSYTPNESLSVKWDRYGIENFRKKDDSDMWEKV